MTLLTLVLIGTSCEDRIDNPAVNSSEGKTVEVSLNIGFADEVDGYDLSASTKTLPGKEGTFNVELTPTTETRATSVKPNKLYKLEIRQYKQDGTFLNGSDPADQTIGDKLTVKLTQAENCQLVFVAWGQGNTSNSLGTKNLSQVQEIAIEADKINNIPVDNMNTMPYVFHLKHVNITGNDVNGVISSPDGEDVRILLKRLATRLTLNWSYPENTKYSLKQILLESIPLNYKVIPKPDENNSYPSLLDQYTTIQLSKDEIDSGTYTCWIPANVRGMNNGSNSALYRIKANAPTGSSYASFIAGHKSEVKKKLNYRVYLGGPAYTDFNLYGNTDYSYTVSFKHDGLPVDDRRVTIIDPIPAYENNENLVPTANCFMVAPGGAFCFNPYTYSQDGADIPNTLLRGWCSSSKIKSVKVLWQTKENGDVGDPVLGVVNSAEDHTNIVAFTDGDNFDAARIYCRVAPNTEGGSGVIAAYDNVNGTGNILWSWHIWVTDYTPDANADTSIDTPNKRVQKYTYGNKIQYPMMDRNLGAKEGYTDIPESFLERSKTNGFHYQWGRKDPFPSSYSETSEAAIVINTDKPTQGMLNLYQPDGISYFARKTSGTTTSIRGAFQNPTVSFSDGNYWCNENNNELWNGSDNKKTVYDPCPAGWRIASKDNYRPFFQNTTYTNSGTTRSAEVSMNKKNPNSITTDGGAVLYFEAESSGRSTYLRMTGYQEYFNQFNYINAMGNLWCREEGRYALVFIEKDLTYLAEGGHNISYNLAARDAHPLRCIQDR